MIDVAFAITQNGQSRAGKRLFALAEKARDALSER